MHPILLLLLAFASILVIHAFRTKPAQPVVLLVFNGEHDVEAENLLASIKQNAKNLQPLIQVCVSDDKSRNFSIKHSLPWFAMSNIETTGSFMSKEMNFFMQRKIEAILHVLRTGHDVLYLDTDIVVLGNPLTEINMQSDINIQNDLCTPPYDNSYLCAGLMYITSNVKTISLFTSVLLEIQKNNYKIDDQRILNAQIQRQKHALSLTMLDVCKFPNGCRYFAHTDRACHNDQAIIIHNNHLRGIENKMQRFKEHNLIFCPSTL